MAEPPYIQLVTRKMALQMHWFAMVSVFAKCAYRSVLQVYAKKCQLQIPADGLRVGGD